MGYLFTGTNRIPNANPTQTSSPYTHLSLPVPVEAVDLVLVFPEDPRSNGGGGEPPRVESNVTEHAPVEGGGGGGKGESYGGLGGGPGGGGGGLATDGLALHGLGSLHGLGGLEREVKGRGREKGREEDGCGELHG